MNDAGTFRLRWRGRESGPFSWPEISRLLDEHEIGLWHEVEVDGVWLTLEAVLALRQREEAALAPTSRPQRIELPVTVGRTPAHATAAGRPRAKRTPRSLADMPEAGQRIRRLKLFVALGLGLGFLGAHNWYAGYRGTALIQLALAALTWWLGLGIFLSWLWALIELLIIHTDSRGRRLV